MKSFIIGFALFASLTCFADGQSYISGLPIEGKTVQELEENCEYHVESAKGAVHQIFLAMVSQRIKSNIIRINKVENFKKSISGFIEKKNYHEETKTTMDCVQFKEIEFCLLDKY